MTENTRTCSKCGEAKPLDQFPRGGKCRACLAAYGREYRRKNPERMRVLEALSYQRTREESIRRATEYYESHREAVLAKARLRYENEDREAKSAQRKAWREANRHRAPEYTRRYREKNPMVTIVINNNRRTRIGGRTVSLADLESIWTGVCALCNEPINMNLTWPDQQSRSVDHIIPLAKGGVHEVSNLQWSHLGCNRRKSDKIL